MSHSYLTKALGVIIAFASLQVSAQNITQPIYHTISFDDQSIIQGMSDNGLWAVSSGSESADVRIINLTDFTPTVISGSLQAEHGSDITDDGSIVVGSNAGKPAYYSTKTGKWTNLPTKDSYTSGTVYSVTPDGSKAVGVIFYGDGYNSKPALWDLTTGKLVDIYKNGGLPKKDMSHADQDMMDFRKISSDGRYVLGCMSYSYLPTSEDLGGCFFFVYDIENKSYKPIGFKETTVGAWTPLADGLGVIMEASMSNNGLFVTGEAHIARDSDLSDFADEYEIPFLYDVQNDSFIAYDETSAMDTYGCAVGNNGSVTNASPVGTPVREWSLRYGKYWFSWAEIMKQRYNTTYKEATGYDNTGTVSNISDDGMRLVSFPDPYCCYVVDLPEPFYNLGEGLKLLGSCTAVPAENAEVSYLQTVQLTFTRAITTVTSDKSATLKDANGKTVHTSTSFKADGKVLTIKFETGKLEANQKYQLCIPAGAIAMLEDATQTNSEVIVNYRGRADQPVNVVSAYPADESTISLIDYSTNPLMLTFDTEIAIADNAVAYIYRNEEATPFCSMVIASNANSMAVYPSTAQYLYEGSDYRVEIAAGAATDVAGNNPSEAIILNYHGNYVRQISADDVILFSDNFDSGYGQFMMWCGDKKTPTEEMIGWDFSQGMAWGLVREDASSDDLIAATHSMYSPAGESDDWLILPQIYLPDMLCSMNFLSQSYKKNKQDRLKVVVYEDDNVYNSIDADIITLMKKNGKIVYDEVQSSGADEETLSGEWSHINIDLAEFAEKNVYIALVNQNNNQSAIFVDSLEVRHDMNYLVSINCESSVVGLTQLTVKGTLIGNNPDKSYDTVTLELFDANENLVDTYTASSMRLGKGVQHQFAFSKALPLTIGLENKFYIKANLDGEENRINASVKDLAFQPVKRVILEEYSGRTCGNCPLGIIAMEKLEERYGDQVLAISAHTYGNDPLGTGLSEYVSQLGLDQLGAPSGMVNRIKGSYPAASSEVDGNYRFYFSAADCPEEETDKLWMDYVADELAVPAECDINVVMKYDEVNQRISVPCQIKYALNATNLNVNIFAALVEDNVSGIQSNYMASISSPDLGEWGLNGKYGQSYVTDYLHQDVCRTVVGLTINGTGGYLPTNVTAGHIYEATIEIPVPSTVTDINECKAVVVMIDANTGAVINAARAKYEAGQITEPRENLGEMQLDSVYVLKEFKNYVGRFTAPESGIVTAEATSNDVLYPYYEELQDMYTEGNAVPVTMNSYFGSRSYDFNVEKGVTYVMYANFVMTDNTQFSISMNGSEIKLKSSSPAEGETFNISNGGQISVDFNKAVAYDKATLSCNSASAEIEGMVMTSSIAFDVKDLVYGWLKEDSINPGDELTLTLTGVCKISDSEALLNGDGVLELHFVLGEMPISLIATQNTEGTFCSWYEVGDPAGLVTLTFSGAVNPEQVKATLKYGNLDNDMNGGYYEEQLPYSVNDAVITVDLTGKRRNVSDMISDGNKYDFIILGVTGVFDMNGNYAYAEGAGSLGSYWFKYDYLETGEGIEQISAPSNKQNRLYNVLGQPVAKTYRGLVIKGN